MHIKKSDQVKIRLGKDRGREGKVLAVYPKKQEALVEGINLYKRHLKPKKQGEKGGIVTRPRPLKVCKLTPICPSCKKATRVAYHLARGQKTRICHACKAPLDQFLKK